MVGRGREMSDQQLRFWVLETLARFAAEPCECAARLERSKLKPDELLYLKPEHVECRAHLSAKALVGFWRKAKT